MLSIFNKTISMKIDRKKPMKKFIKNENSKNKGKSKGDF